MKNNHFDIKWINCPINYDFQAVFRELTSFLFIEDTLEYTSTELLKLQL